MNTRQRVAWCFSVATVLAGCAGTFPSAERYVEEASRHSPGSVWYLQEGTRLFDEALSEVRRDERTATRAVKALATHLYSPETFKRALDVYNMIWSRGPAIELESTRAIMDEIASAVEAGELRAKHRVGLAHYWVVWSWT